MKIKFCNFFGGENKLFQQEVTYSNYNEKKRRMRIFSARIFSKSFGGKIEHGQTNVNKEHILRKILTQHHWFGQFAFTPTLNLWLDFTDNL